MDVDRAAVQSAVEEMGLDFEDVLREDYRGKFETRAGFAIEIDHPDLANEFFVEMAGFDHTAARELARRGKRDSMGKRFILYFPGCDLVLH